MPRLLVIDDRDTTIDMIQRRLPQLETVTRCGKSIPCQVCEEREKGCTLRAAHDWEEAQSALAAQVQLPDLVALDLHFALPEERLLPLDKSALPSGKARAKQLEQLRRHQGLLILEKLRASYPSLPVILLTTTQEEVGSEVGSEVGGELGSEPGGHAGAGRDPLVYFAENEVVDSRTLAAEITRALELQHTMLEGEVFWGKSRAMASLRRSLNLLARSPLPLLIEGETGSGKSYLAEHVLHPRSGAKGPLVITDLSTIPAALLPAHLFGAQRGAYTGATQDHAGVFEQAHGGTLFLDEIGNLELDLQRQLLLVLERGAVTRLGDSRSRPAQPRLLAATNQDLSALVAQGKFRADLFMRLNPATRLRLPALRERREDLPELLRFALLGALRSEPLRALVRQYLARFPTPDGFAEENSVVIYGRPQARSAPRDAFAIFVSKESLAKLVAHAWPGNQRELRLFAVNALVSALAQALDLQPNVQLEGHADSQRAPAILQLSDALVAGLLGKDGARKPKPGAVRARSEGRAVEVSIAANRSFAEVAADVERQYLRALFELHEGNLDAMAEELLGPGAPARKLHLRLNQLGLRVRDLRSGGA